MKTLTNALRFTAIIILSLAELYIGTVVLFTSLDSQTGGEPMTDIEHMTIGIMIIVFIPILYTIHKLYTAK